MRIGKHVAAPAVSYERGLATGRAAAAAALVLILPLHRPAWTPGALLAVAVLLLSAAAVLRPELGRRLAPSLLDPRAMFAVEALAACLVTAAYPSPDVLSWLGFIGLICAGGARWTLNGATAGYGVYLAGNLAVAHFEGAFSMVGPSGIRVGIIGMTSTVIGIFARSAAQFRALQARTDALAESERSLHNILDTSPAAVVTVDPSGVITDWSRRAEQLFGFAATGVLGKHLDDVLLRRDDSATAWRPVQTECPTEGSALRRDGGEVAVEMVVSAPLRIGGEVRHAVFVSDISVRKRTELRKEVQASVVRGLAESPSLQSGVERFLEVMCAGLGWQAGRLWRVDLEYKALCLMNAWHGDGVDLGALDAIDGELRCKRGAMLPGIAWDQDATVVMPTAQLKRTPRRRVLREAGLQHCIAFPIVTDGGVIGVAEFFSEQAIDVDDMLDMLASIGAHAGLFIERRLEEAAHRETAMRLQSLLDSVGDGIITFDETGAIESANHAAGRLFGCTAEQLTRATIDVLLAPDRRSGITARLERGVMDWETEGLRRDGSMFPMELRAGEMRLRGRRLFIATLRDTSELKARTMALQHQAMHDNLTGLPNRTLLGDRLTQAINHATRAGQPAALLLMDMDGFKEVNDTLGHHSGDALLRQVAERLRSTLRAEDTIARLGGDEFAILPAGCCDEDTAMHIADKVLAAFQAPFLIEEQAIHARMSIGVAVYPAHGEDADMLMRRADVAMYTAKRMRSGQSTYSPAQDEHSKRRLQLTGELRRAIPASELVLHYQPRLHIPTGTITALEALVRWQHPVHGLVPPGEFIPVAEQSDLIHPLTAWVAGEAVRQCRVFAELGMDLTIAINVSARNLADQRLPTMMAGLLRTWGVGASRLRLEMTESVVMASDWQDVLNELHELGLSVAIDDFGVGYSSLAYLQRLPVDEIKIDRSFVGDMAENPDNAAIVRSTIELGHNLGLKVVAEGVETQECLRMLADFGCDAAQGFLVSPPLAASEVVAFFAETDVNAFAFQRSA
ncbi:MAG TPA: EAL domain-containing protein [Candidatus Angelobacter sp.]|nr:EAL domain-containing protein [Candidatus Angelobacter sp.]